MSLLVKNIFRFIFFVLLQVYVLDKVRLHQMVTPYVYFLFIFWLPFNLNRTWQMLLAFLLGYTIDSFRHHPGFHAAACVLIAYLRPFFINILMPQEGVETNYREPSMQSMGGFFPYMVYVAILVFFHNVWLFFLEAWQFGSIWYFLVKTFLSTLISVALILIFELLFYRKQQYRTNVN